MSDVTRAWHHGCIEGAAEIASVVNLGSVESGVASLYGIVAESFDA